MNKKIAIAAALAATTGLASVAQAQGIQLAPEELERDVYFARPGDTLFDISAGLFGDALMWPLLWAFNPQITNPHWIYPGDAIFLEPFEPDPPPPPPLPPSAFFPLAGFWTGEEIATYGELKYADTGRRLLAEHDTVFLEFDDPDSVQVGQRYAINRVIGRVEDDDDELVAVKYLVTGMVQITARHVETDLVSGRILEIWDTVERGDVLFASQPQLLRITQTPANVDLEARIEGHLTPVSNLHEQHVVFINAGWEDGVEPGNVFHIWDRQDEAEMIRAARTRRLDYEEDIRAELPWHVAGEATVIYTTDEYSTAVITDAGMRELRDGMRVTLQAGH